MVFIQYDTVAFNEDSNGDDLIHTVTYKCIIQVEFTAIQLDGPSEVVRIYAAATGSQEERNLFYLAGATFSDGIARHYSPVLNSGDTIRASRQGEGAVGTLHIFRIPETE